MRVGKQGTPVTGRLPNCGQLIGSTVADDYEVAPFFGKCGLVFRQFSDLLTAEHSAKMTDEHYDGRAMLPQGAEFNALIVFIKNLQCAE